MVVAIPLRDGPKNKGLVALIDDEDLAVVGLVGWRAKRDRNSIYAVREVVRDGKRTTERMHQLILHAPEGHFLDHIDRDGLNNTRANLRPATHGENARNSRRQRNNTSGFRGACWDKVKSRWKATIMYEGRVIGLGSHRTAEDAARAFDEAARRLFGQFARLNFPGDGEQGV